MNDRFDLDFDLELTTARYSREDYLTCDAYLMATTGTQKGAVIELDLLENHQVMIGRRQFEDDRLLHIPDPNISRRHCIIQFKENEFSLQDLDSKNGTWVNGRPVERVKLMDGDRIQIGTCMYIFRRIRGEGF